MNIFLNPEILYQITRTETNVFLSEKLRYVYTIGPSLILLLIVKT